MNHKTDKELIEKTYELAKERYKKVGIDTDAVISKLKSIPVSIHCWQGDDVTGFEPGSGGAGGGTLCTGNYPGKATNPQQLRSDLDKVLSLLPGSHRLNLHSTYAETNGEAIDRDKLKPEHFDNWINWAKEKNIGLDFNPSYYSHPKAESGLTLSHPDKKIRDFWIEHGKACRKISEHMGKETGSPSIMNTWIPDGYKDIPVDRKSARLRLEQSLNEIFSEDINPEYHKDAVECKLFGIGAESCTVGSHEFYMGYAMKNQKLLCLDAGHFHPTEVISDKISSVLQYVDEILLHVSRPVRWDSDHVVTFDDELQSIAAEIIRGDFLDQVHIGLDFFDATINRVAAWIIGTRNMIKSLCKALLEPIETLKDMETNEDYTARLVLLEEMKMMPFSAVWDYYCLNEGVPVGFDWLSEVKEYEKDVLMKR